MKKLFLSLFFLLISVCAFSATIQGVVCVYEYNENTKQEELVALPGALVRVFSSKNNSIATVSTDTEGRFSTSFSCLSSPITIKISYIGYETDETILPCGPNTVIDMNCIILNPIVEDEVDL